MNSSLSNLSFKVYGKVQGVFFRVETQKKAKSLSLVGWVKNAPEGIVVGECQGTQTAIMEMKNWLTNIG
jgi:acylphosphatase